MSHCVFCWKAGISAVPAVFLVYIDDLYNRRNLLKASLFAYDANVRVCIILKLASFGKVYQPGTP